VGLITRPEESYRVGASECDPEASTMGRPWPTRGCRTIRKEQYPRTARFKVLTVVMLKMNVALCRLVNNYRRFVGS
jgi:hypothetical protein